MDSTDAIFPKRVDIISLGYWCRRADSVDWEFVDSSAFISAAYDEANHQLYLRFQSGEIYRYFEFPLHRYQEFLAAESKGGYFAEAIRDQFRYEHIRVA